ncbi:MAG: hypothetical protein LUH82_04940 [Clostridiales bacterium]|nr:hypothetical protein [Clostridiales bacterium]
MVNINDSITKMSSDILQKLVGKQFMYYKQDEFMFTNDVYGIVGLCIENEFYALTNFIETRDYFGANEDVGIFKFCVVSKEDIHSYIQGKQMIKMPVNAQIARITVINEHQKLFKDGIQTYDVQLTRGIIFELSDGLEILFEKDIWLSEDITIRKGYKLIDKIASTDTNGWESEYRFEYERQNILFE